MQHLLTRGAEPEPLRVNYTLDRTLKKAPQTDARRESMLNTDPPLSIGKPHKIRLLSLFTLDIIFVLWYNMHKM